MLEAVEAVDGHIEQVYYCPHDGHENCTCRKPEPGMLLRAAEDYPIDLTRSFIVGDAWTDVQAGLTVGARAILVMTGRGTGHFAQCLTRFPVRFGAACDIADATDIIYSALEGEEVDNTPRLRRAFHMALNPQELTVL
jgi:histidinol phosphatase-like enzyme